MYQTGRQDTPIFRRDDLCSGHRINGPAIVEEGCFRNRSLIRARASSSTSTVIFF